MITTAIEQRLNPNYIIDVSKPFHVSWWATALDATEQDLIRAVNAVGARAIEVFYYLRHEGARSTKRRSHRRLHVWPNHVWPNTEQRSRSREPTSRPRHGVAGEGHGLRTS